MVWAEPDKANKMPSELFQTAFFISELVFLFLPVFSLLPPSLSAPPPTPAAKLSVFLPILPTNLNKEAIGLKSDKENKIPSESVLVP